MSYNKFKYDFLFNFVSLIITIITVSILMGRIIERIDNVITRLEKIENQYSELLNLDKRVAILEDKMYNINNNVKR